MLYERAADYVANIWRDRKPSGLPVARPAGFELVINLKTAKVLGARDPPDLHVRTEIIE